MSAVSNVLEMKGYICFIYWAIEKYYTHTLTHRMSVSRLMTAYLQNTTERELYSNHFQCSAAASQINYCLWTVEGVDVFFFAVVKPTMVPNGMALEAW